MSRRSPAVAIGLVRLHKCPCFACGGSLVLSDKWPHWRTCQDCRCFWAIGEYPDRARVEHCRMATTPCPASVDPEPEPALAGRGER